MHLKISLTGNQVSDLVSASELLNKILKIQHVICSYSLDTHINKPPVSLINYKEHHWEYYIIADTLQFCCMENKM